jgi:hypothetical protein
VSGEYAVDTRLIGGIEYRVGIVDEECESPRDTDAALSVIVAPSHRHRWPTEDGDTVCAGHVAAIVEEFDFPVVARWLRVFHGASVVVPAYAGHDEFGFGDELDRKTFRRPCPRRCREATLGPFRR